jgi:5-methylcytosine-specific restriction endonuclease McrA
MSLSLSRAVLVLNAAYEPLNVVSVQRAMVLLCKGAAVVQETSQFVLRTPKLTIPLPSVIRLLTYRRVPRHSRAVSRKNILIRDSYSCQYCGSALSAAKLTLDHVIPRSRHGKSTWENLVACCYPCNNRKDNRTPTEAGMELLKVPVSFSIHSKHRLLGRDEAAWKPYLFFQ